MAITHNLPQTQQSAAGQQQRKYVFRLLGSVYEESAGESEARPTVIEIPIYADDAEIAQKVVSEVFEEFVRKQQLNKLKKVLAQNPYADFPEDLHALRQRYLINDDESMQTFIKRMIDK